MFARIALSAGLLIAALTAVVLVFAPSSGTADCGGPTYAASAAAAKKCEADAAVKTAAASALGGVAAVAAASGAAAVRQGLALAAAEESEEAAEDLLADADSLAESDIEAAATAAEQAADQVGSAVGVTGTWLAEAEAETVAVGEAIPAVEAAVATWTAAISEAVARADALPAGDPDRAKLLQWAADWREHVEEAATLLAAIPEATAKAQQSLAAARSAHTSASAAQNQAQSSAREARTSPAGRASIRAATTATRTGQAQLADAQATAEHQFREALGLKLRLEKLASMTATAPLTSVSDITHQALALDAKDYQGIMQAAREVKIQAEAAAGKALQAADQLSRNNPLSAPRQQSVADLTEAANRVADHTTQMLRAKTNWAGQRAELARLAADFDRKWANVKQFLGSDGLAQTDYLGFAHAVSDAADRAEATAKDVARAAAVAREHGLPSAALEQQADNLAERASRAREVADRISLAKHEFVTLGAAEAGLDAELDQCRAEAAQALGTTWRRWLAADTVAPSLAPLYAQQVAALELAGGKPVRQAAAFQELTRFRYGVNAAQTGQALALAAPIPGQSLLTTPVRQVVPVPGVHEVTARKPLPQLADAEDKPLEADTEYEVQVQIRDAGKYTARYRTDANGDIAEAYLEPGKAAAAASNTQVRANPELNNPRPKTAYHVDKDFAYLTDAFARTQFATAVLQYIGSEAGQRYSVQSPVGRKGTKQFADRLKPKMTVKFEGAHFFATMYDGPGERINLVAGLRELNRALGGTYETNWGRFEENLTAYLRAGQAVTLTVEAVYPVHAPGDEPFRTPASFRVWLWVDGKLQAPLVFPNFPTDPSAGFTGPPW